MELFNLVALGKMFVNIYVKDIYIEDFCLYCLLINKLRQRGAKLELKCMIFLFPRNVCLRVLAVEQVMVKGKYKAWYCSF